LAAGASINHMIDWSTCECVEQNPEIVSGVWGFEGARGSISALFENLEDGAQDNEFVEWFPGGTIEQVKSVLEHVARGSAA